MIEALVEVLESKFIHVAAELETQLWAACPMAPICWLGTDGEPAMCGQRDGLPGRLKRRNVHLVSYHCASHHYQQGHADAEMAGKQADFGMQAGFDNTPRSSKQTSREKPVH